MLKSVVLTAFLVYIIQLLILILLKNKFEFEKGLDDVVKFHEISYYILDILQNITCIWTALVAICNKISHQIGLFTYKKMALNPYQDTSFMHLSYAISIHFLSNTIPTCVRVASLLDEVISVFFFDTKLFFWDDSIRSQ